MLPHRQASAEQEHRPTAGQCASSLGVSLLDHPDGEKQECYSDVDRCSQRTQRESLLASKVVMRVAGVCAHSDVTKWPTILLGMCLWGLIFAILFSMVWFEHFDFSEFRCYNTLATIVWCTHSSLMFTIVAKDSILDGGQLDSLIWSMASEDFVLPGTVTTEDTLTNPTHGYRNLKRLTAKIATVVVVCAFINWVVSFATFTNNFTSRLLPTGDSVAANAFVVALWLFYCVGWFLPVYFVRVPCALMMCRVNRYIKYLDRATACSDFDLMEAMGLYDCLYKSNGRLKKSIGFMVTTSLGLLSVHGILLLLATLRNELSSVQRFSLLFWFFINTVISAVLAFSIADLDFGNRRIEMAFAQASSDIQFCSDQQCIRFQLALSKISKTPFGVPFWGLKTPVSFSMTFKLAGIVLSAYLFLLGYNN